MVDDFLEIFLCCADSQRSEPTDSVGDEFKEGVAGIYARLPLQPQIDRGRLGAFEVGTSFVHFRTTKVGPQRGTRDESSLQARHMWVSLKAHLDLCDPYPRSSECESEAREEAD